MGIPRKDVLPSGISSRKHPVVALSHFIILANSMIIAAVITIITHGSRAGTSRALDITSSGILSRTTAGNDTYMVKRLSAFPVSFGNTGTLFSNIPINRHPIVVIILSIKYRSYHPRNGTDISTTQ
jgi:hypothetical protein